MLRSLKSVYHAGTRSTSPCDSVHLIQATKKIITVVIINPNKASTIIPDIPCYHAQLFCGYIYERSAQSHASNTCRTLHNYPRQLTLKLLQLGWLG